MLSRQPTLLRKLLRKEQRRECSLVLQPFRYLGKTDFFATPLQDDSQWDDIDKLTDESTETQSVGGHLTGPSRLPEAASVAPAYQEMLAAIGVDKDDIAGDVSDDSVDADYE